MRAISCQPARAPRGGRESLPVDAIAWWSASVWRTEGVLIAARFLDARADWCVLTSPLVEGCDFARPDTHLHFFPESRSRKRRRMGVGSHLVYIVGAIASRYVPYFTHYAELPCEGIPKRSTTRCLVEVSTVQAAHHPRPKTLSRAKGKPPSPSSASHLDQTPTQRTKNSTFLSFSLSSLSSTPRPHSPHPRPPASWP